MIRSLLEKHLNPDPESASDSFEMAVQPAQEIPLEPTKDIQVTNTDIQTTTMEEFSTAMETFRQHL